MLQYKQAGRFLAPLLCDMLRHTLLQAWHDMLLLLHGPLSGTSRLWESVAVLLHMSTLPAAAAGQQHMQWNDCGRDCVRQGHALFQGRLQGLTGAAGFLVPPLGLWQPADMKLCDNGLDCAKTGTATCGCGPSAIRAGAGASVSRSCWCGCAGLSCLIPSRGASAGFGMGAWLASTASASGTDCCGEGAAACEAADALLGICAEDSSSAIISSSGASAGTAGC